MRSNVHGDDYRPTLCPGAQRKSYFNVRGPYSQELRSLFDELARDLRHFADLIAKRIVSAGGYAVATSIGGSRIRLAGAITEGVNEIGMERIPLLASPQGGEYAPT